MGSKYRHEWKYEINAMDKIVLQQRLGLTLARDAHGDQGKYFIRSLYFDDLKDTALREKVDGASRREKFRIRYYDFDTSVIHLEKKSKENGLCCKVSAPLSKKEVERILAGDYEWMKDSDRPLVRELYIKMKNKGLRPKTIVDYTREAFVYGPGNVRVTLDYNIRLGMKCDDFFNPHGITIPTNGIQCLLEVKWDEFLPDIVKNAVHLPGRRVGAFSKYAACRYIG